MRTDREKLADVYQRYSLIGINKMFCNLFNKKSSLKKLLREQDNVPLDIKSKFLNQYTASFIKISELKKRKKSPAVTKHIKFLKNTLNKELVVLYKYYRIANETERVEVLNTLEKIVKYRKAINLSVTIDEISSTFK